MTEAVSAVIAAAISAIVSAAVALAVNFQSHEQFFSTTISAERMNWIKDMRKLCVELFSICEQYEPENLSTEQYANFLRARNGILVRLFPKGWCLTDNRLNEFLLDPDYAKIRANLPEIREICVTVFKSEWDKVKIEAGNSRRKAHKIKVLQEKMEKEYRILE